MGDSFVFGTVVVKSCSSTSQFPAQLKSEAPKKVYPERLILQYEQVELNKLLSTQFSFLFLILCYILFYAVNGLIWLIFSKMKQNTIETLKN